MLYLFTFLVFIMGFINAAGFCDNSIFGRIAGCVSDQQNGVNIDVLRVADATTGSRVLCSGKPIAALLRFTPPPGASLGTQSILYGDSLDPVAVPLGNCPANIPNPPGALCGSPPPKAYAFPGEYPAAVFATTDNGIDSQVDGFLSIKRCANPINLDLVVVYKGDFPPPGGFATVDRTICAGDDLVAVLRATPADGSVVVNTFGQSEKAALWTGELSPAGQPLGFQFINATGVVQHPTISFPYPGSWPVALFAETNEGEVQLEALVDVKDCSAK